MPSKRTGEASNWAPSGPGGALREWLRVQAGVNERILDKVLRSLDDAEVFEVEDLVHLERLPGFGQCFSEVTGSKVREALSRQAASAAMAASEGEE